MTSPLYIIVLCSTYRAPKAWRSCLCAYVTVYVKLPPSPVILWIELGGKPKWHPLHFGYVYVYHDIMRKAPIVPLDMESVITGPVDIFR